MGTILQAEDRPVLYAVRSGAGNFQVQTLAYLARAERFFIKESGYLPVAPERKGQGQVLLLPVAKADAFAG